MAIVTLGIDIAKNVFALHGVNDAGKPVLLKPQVPRAKLLELIAALPPCTIGLEACGGAHHWARQFQRHGHTVRQGLGRTPAARNAGKFPSFAAKNRVLLPATNLDLCDATHAAADTRGVLIPAPCQGAGDVRSS